MEGGRLEGGRPSRHLTKSPPRKVCVRIRCALFISCLHFEALKNLPGNSLARRPPATSYDIQKMPTKKILRENTAKFKSIIPQHVHLNIMRNYGAGDGAGNGIISPALAGISSIFPQTVNSRGKKRRAQRIPFILYSRGPCLFENQLKKSVVLISFCVSEL